MTARLLADDLIVLSLHPGTGRPWRRVAAFNCGLAGALLTELALAGRVQWDGSRILGAQPDRHDDDPLTGLAERIAADPRRRTVAWWVRRVQGRRLRRTLLRRAADSGLLRAEGRHRPFGVGAPRYYAADPRAADALRAGLARAVRGSHDPDARTAALLALVGAMGMDERLFPDLPRDERRRRITEAVDGDQVGVSVRSAIQRIRFAVAAAVAWGLLRPVLPF